MKRFLRYFLYRELYRWLRNASKDDESNSSKPRDSTTRRSTDRDTDTLPIEEGPIESVGELEAVLQQMDPYEFEHFIAELWTRMGWETTVSSASTDKGVDVIARKETPYEQTLLIQAKRYGPNSTVGLPDIQQYSSLRHQYDDVDKVLVVTTNEFTGQARELADQLNVKLINGNDLAELIAEQEALDLVDEYLDFVTTVDADGDVDQQEPDDTGKGTPAASSSESDVRSGSLPRRCGRKPSWSLFRAGSSRSSALLSFLKPSGE